MGATNPNPLSYLPEDEAREMRERLGITPNIRVPVYILVSEKENEVLIITTERGYALPILTSPEIAAEHRKGFRVPMRINEIATTAQLRVFVEHLIANAKTDRKTVILYDSAGTEERIATAIPVQDFLAAIPS